MDDRLNLRSEVYGICLQSRSYLHVNAAKYCTDSRRIVVYLVRDIVDGTRWTRSVRPRERFATSGLSANRGAATPAAGKQLARSKKGALEDFPKIFGLGFDSPKNNYRHGAKQRSQSRERVRGAC